MPKISFKPLFAPKVVICFYDNPKTMKREYWRNKRLVIELEKEHAKTLHSNEWDSGAIHGDKKAMNRKTASKDGSKKPASKD